MKQNIISLIAVATAAIFAFLLYQEKKNNEPVSGFTVDSFSALDSTQKNKIREIAIADYLESWKKKYQPLTDPIDPTSASDWVRSYKLSSFYSALTPQEGEYHDLDKLIKYFQVWKTKGVTRVDFRYAKIPATDAHVTYRNRFTIIMFPQINNVDMTPSNGPDAPFTMPLNLGDLHP